MTSAPERDATLFAERLARTCAETLASQVVAVILHGSLTLGDFVPARSDVDLITIVEAPLADGEIEALGTAVADLPDEAPYPVDLRMVTRAVASAPSPEPPMEAFVHLRPGGSPEVEARVASEPDLVVELSIVRSHGCAIVGAQPSAAIGAVPHDWVVAIGDRQLAAWERLVDDEAHAELMVLTACRIWRFSLDGVHTSKAGAGRWALARDPSLVAVEDALRRRAGGADVVVGADGIRRLLGVVRSDIARRRAVAPKRP